MSTIDSESHWLHLRRTSRTVVVVDVVESVRLMEQNQDDVIRRWLEFVAQVEVFLLTQHSGRLVKSLGDGLMLEFEATQPAIQCAFAMHHLITSANVGRPAGECIWLRVGMNVTDVVVDERDIYGSGVNLAARITTLAGPGEIVVSAGVRDGLTPGLDADVEDLGDCYLKHVNGTVRVYRVGPPGTKPVLSARRQYAEAMQPTIAVIPFTSRANDPSHAAVGELIADGIIALLSHARHLRVISRLSTTAFRGRETSIGEIATHLGATYVLSGGYTVMGERLIANWELADARSQLVIDAHHSATRVQDLVDLDGDLVHTVATRVHDSILKREVRRVRTQPLPTLESYALLLGGIRLLHRFSKREFELSFELFNHLAQLHPQSIEPWIWQAKWYALRAVQGLCTDREHDTRAALACTGHARDRDPENAFALAMEGFVHCHLSKDYAAAHSCLAESVELNPSETFGHLFSGLIQGLEGNFVPALDAYELAVSTSPLDPAKYLLDSIGSYLHLGAGHHGPAITLAQRALRQNRNHAHSWRILTVAQVEVGNVVAAKDSMRQLLTLQPDLTVKRYLAAAEPEDETRRRFADAMNAAGLPAA